ncbi:hypothetical protein [Reyranella sp.]|uniref:hypothetical protein n=1 Tax=Reyranella sp. TaxID=1929291 RepID=UPI003D0D9228
MSLGIHALTPPLDRRWGGARARGSLNGPESKTAMKSPRIAVALPPAVMRWVANHAARRGVSSSRVLREIAEAHVLRVVETEKAAGEERS